LLYAIGEIVLVVIGILIALQINNWNEDNKGKAFEREMLSQIQDNLKKDKAKLIEINASFTKAIASADKILAIGPEDHIPDSLRYWLAYFIQFERFQPITNSYEALKSRGLDQVSNKELRLLLGEYYDDEISHTIKSVGDIEKSFNDEWVPIMEQYIVDFKFKEFLIVSDPSIFQRPSIARNIMILNKDNYQGAITRASGAIKTVEKLERILSESFQN
ncbi:MAG: hypothetical protein KDC57_11125, partial [Saprospiraceae bacterium]|nr:hypothetical protein [Saprospiraceae bacterium]